MVWVMWRQHRVQALATVGALLVLGMFVLASGESAAAALSWLPIVPLLVGVFWGAPLLAREFERGTHRLAWTQSVPRRTWLMAKFGWLGLAVTGAGLAVGLIVSAWVTAFDADRFGDAALFGGTGVAVGAWWLFAFLLGAAAGGWIRRLLPALAVTVAVFVVALFGMFQARDEYAEPLRQVSEVAPVGTFTTGGGWLSPSGTEVDDPPECANEGNDTYLDCVRQAGYRSVVYYQPADRYWRFQWTEAGILLLGGLLLAGPVVWRVLRRPV